MDKKQFDRFMTVLERMEENTMKIVENTKSPGRPMKILELIGLIATISGILSAVQLIIDWFWRK